MDVLASQKIEKFGTTRFSTDSSDDLIAGRSAVLRMEPEQGQPITFVPITTPEEAQLISTLFDSIAQGSPPAQVRSWLDDLTQEVGYTPDYDDLARRYQKARDSF